MCSRVGWRELSITLSKPPSKPPGPPSDPSSQASGTQSLGLKLNTFSLFPVPLLVPEKWPSPGVWDSVWVLPIDVASFAGGPLKAYFETIQKKSTFAWFVPKNFLTSDRSTHQKRTRTEPSVEMKLRRECALEMILEHPGKGLILEDATAEGLHHSVPGLAELPILEMQRGDLAQSPSAWAKAIYSIFWQAVGDGRAEKILSDYANEFSEVADFPWEGLRFFSGFVRQNYADLAEAAELAARDWAKFQALFSPQDEKSEKASLGKNEIMLNPTAQTLRRITGADQDLSIMIRKGTVVSEISLTWMDAALIDAVNEEARVDRARLIAMVESEHRGSFASALDRLIGNEILFEGL